MPASFLIIGPAIPESPVLLSVPHAGRDYPDALCAALRAPVASLRTLEDRHVDAIALAARERETLLLQTLPRAWIDLNRAEHERDPVIDSGARGGPLSAKVRAGLGIVPRRTSTSGDLWRRRLDGVEVEARIAADHRPYHMALAELIARARQRFGIAILLDVHSMPPIAGSRARVVIGDRFGRAAAARLVHRIEAEVEGYDIRCALNTPYAGGHILERHARPHANVHAIQLEIDRSLYLDRQLDQPGPGMPLVTQLLRRVIDALTDEAMRDSIPPAQAAE
ncbi:N-formylglutamate amidohydrolase [Sphingomonas sp.]|jgi:N-formylglutamate amidohydrolase|uniref:N-formylglutamate amidohydrolase n=1 Tax=Sphingomonas sp. TaxID=28214 RepID=UPI0035C7FDBA